jgi:predicted acyltransferase
MNIHSRNLSLDVFRGLTVCFMIIVNTPGSGQFSYSPLQHAAWHGFTPTDLVFPSFLFAVGSALYFSRLSWTHFEASQVYKRIIKRTVIIFLLGFLMYWFPFVRPTDEGWQISPFSHTRVLGVLQRIALCYGVAAVLIYWLDWKKILAIAIAVLMVYWGLMAWGGDYSMLGNLGQKIDLKILGENHLYHGEGVAFDPEGILSTLPSLANVLFGFLVTYYLEKTGRQPAQLVRLLLAGIGLVLISWLWHQSFPINKKLWTSSFVLTTVGWDMIILSALIYIIDQLKWQKWTGFFLVPGRNPLAVYLFSEILAILLHFFITPDGRSYYSTIYSAVFQPLGNYFGSFMFAIVFMLICWLFGYYLDKKGIYLKA